MVSDLVLVGSGGCMRELVWQLQELNKRSIMWNVIGYVDNKPSDYDGTVSVGGQRLNYLGNDNFLLNKLEETNVAICVGSPALRKKIAEKIANNPKIQFPNLILGDTKICEDAKLGKGCIVSMDVRISTNVAVGDFVFFNTGSMVCHDGCIGNYVTLGPDVKLAGTVTVGMNCELGIGTKVIQGVCIGNNITTGAGTVVIRNIYDEGTYVGVPAYQLGGKNENSNHSRGRHKP